MNTKEKIIKNYHCNDVHCADSDCERCRNDFDKVLKEYEEEIRAEEQTHIVGILFGIDRQVAELVKEILNKENK